MSDAIRLQPVVPAGNGRGEAVSAIVEPAVPAGTDCGASDAVESPQPVEALVEALEAELVEARKTYNRVLYGNDTGDVFEAHGDVAALKRSIAIMRRRASTGGNSILNEPKSDNPTKKNP